MTPDERAELALGSARAFCRLMAECRTFKVPGWWEGSAFRMHPVGLIVGTVKMTNHWHTTDMCNIVITNGAGWNREVCQESAAYGNPYPQPIDGDCIEAWIMGRWVSSDFEAALAPRMRQILADAAHHIDACREVQARADIQRNAAAREARDKVVALAIAKAQGAA